MSKVCYVTGSIGVVCRDVPAVSLVFAADET